MKRYLIFLMGMILALPSSYSDMESSLFALDIAKSLFSGGSTPQRDLSLDVYCSGIRPGHKYTYYITVNNHGNTTESPSLYLLLDKQIKFPSLPDGFSYDGRSHQVSGKLDGLQAGESKRIKFIGQAPKSLEEGTKIHLEASLDPTFYDNTPSDNSFSLDEVARKGPFNPNDKLVNEDSITPFQRNLTYTIRFQNTGALPAQNIRIRDTIDPGTLILQSVIPAGSSHPFTLDYQGDILIIRFDDINLPDSANDRLASNGFFRFKIITRPNLPGGTLIKNRGAIYFDNAAPEFTSQTETIVFGSNGISTKVETSNIDLVKLYPNPCKDWLHLSGLEGKTTSVVVLDLKGREILRFTLQENASLDLRNLNAGIYFLDIHSEENRILKKITILD